VLDLVRRVMVVDGGRVVLDGPKEQVLAALSGVRPAPPQASAGAGAPSNLHLHPSARPVDREASV
jgi:ATP-binding cassette subfamily C protein LapB